MKDRNVICRKCTTCTYVCSMWYVLYDMAFSTKTQVYTFFFVLMELPNKKMFCFFLFYIFYQPLTNKAKQKKQLFEHVFSGFYIILKKC